MQGIDISNAPASLIEATKAAILRCWTDSRSLDEAILEAASDTYDTAIAKGCNNEQAEVLGMFVVTVGAHMRSNAHI
ncbi:hypothetical protein [Plantactinospora sp. WMMB782]|uniref:hypothetical protein n=1 Tax=Plantactinospora sp. WMMB782 TaxID=3404121 RepID=UPI003B92FD0C